MPSSLPIVALSGLVVVLGAMTLLWVVSLRLGDASIVDPFWGPGFALVTATYLVVDGRFVERGLLAFVLVTAWAARLGWHLLRRNRREGEDKRYAAMREAGGPGWAVRSLVTVFWLQAVLLWIISAPLFGSVVSDAALGPWDLAGALLFFAGLTVEALADLQLARFKADPGNAGRVLDTGLWRYSRHPNYFGEFVLWWGLYLVAVGGGAYWTVVGALLISFLLLKVSGVTMLERSLKETKPQYADYVRRTSTFVPWPPKQR
jgi:steroid 5-alpha reductase family enzyme